MLMRWRRSRTSVTLNLVKARSSRPFGMPTEMGDVMATLLLVVDAWWELAREMQPQRYGPADRVEVLGQLVRLVALRFNGFRWLPRRDDIKPVLSAHSVGLQIRSAPRVGEGLATLERALARYGFTIESVPETNHREIVVSCHNLAGAQVLAFPSRAALAKLRRR